MTNNETPQNGKSSTLDADNSVGRISYGNKLQLIYKVAPHCTSTITYKNITFTKHHCFIEVVSTNYTQESYMTHNRFVLDTNHSYMTSNRSPLEANHSYMTSNRSLLEANHSYMMSNRSLLEANHSYMTSNRSLLSVNHSYMVYNINLLCVNHNSGTLLTNPYRNNSSTIALLSANN